MRRLTTLDTMCTKCPAVGRRWEGVAVKRRCGAEASLGRSLQGGLAGTRRYSRRQAIGLLGGSLAGVGLLSLGLAAPAKSLVSIGPGRQLMDGDQIHLECLGDQPGPRWLDGRTQDGTVGLAPNTQPPYSGTLWRVSVLSDYFNNYAFYCEGTGTGNARYLDGRTQDGTVGLAPGGEQYTGAEWHLTTDCANNPNNCGYYLYCKGTGPGDARYLDGRTGAGDVVLSPTTNKPFTGTRWWIHLVP
jgi:hypothetical protein